MMRTRDERDSVFHDVSGAQAERAIVARHARWAAKQSKAHQLYFCGHGYYVGHNGVFAGTCPGCTAQG